MRLMLLLSMRLTPLLMLSVVMTGCATTSLVERKRQSVLQCVYSMKEYDATTMDAFEVCRQLYNVKRVE